MSRVCSSLSSQRDADHERAGGLRERRAIPAWSMVAGIAILFLGVVGYAKVTGQWNTNLPKQVYLELVPNASAQEHPIPDRQ